MNINREEKWVIFYATILMIATSIPYLLGYIHQGEDWRFTGFVFGVEDGNSYIAKMVRGASGDWLFTTPYTAFPQRGALFFLPYILLGKLSSAPGQHEQLVALYHLFRVAAGFYLICMTYKFIAVFIKTIGIRRLALVLATAGGGLGWLLLLFDQPNWLGSLALEFTSPESFGFLSLFGLPHLSLARALLLYGLVQYIGLPENETQGRRNILKGGVAWLLLGLVQPATVMIGWAIISVHLLFTKLANRFQGLQDNHHLWPQSFQRVLWMVVLSSPVVIYSTVVFWFDPYLSQWSAQNIIKSPHPLHYLLAYGLVLPFAVVGGIDLWRKNLLKGIFLIGWVACLPLLVYAPVNIQRRLAEGIWVAFAILASVSFEDSKGKWYSNFRPAFLLSAPSTVLMVAGGLAAVLNPSVPVFRPTVEIHAYEALAEISDREDVVLAAYEDSNAIPAWAPVRVPIGHGPESVNLNQLQILVNTIYDADTEDSAREELLNQLAVKYIVWGDAERSMGNWNPRTANYLQLLYPGEVEVYGFRVSANKP